MQENNWNLLWKMVRNFCQQEFNDDPVTITLKMARVGDVTYPAPVKVLSLVEVRYELPPSGEEANPREAG